MNDQAPQLARLAAHLAARRLDVDLVRGGLLVRNPAAPACCSETGQDTLADTITCHPRTETGGAMWFYTSWRQPITEVHKITDAVAVITGYLAAGSRGATRA